MRPFCLNCVQQHDWDECRPPSDYSDDEYDTQWRLVRFVRHISRNDPCNDEEQIKITRPAKVEFEDNPRLDDDKNEQQQMATDPGK